MASTVAAADHPRKDVLRERSVPLTEILPNFDPARTPLDPGTTLSIRFFPQIAHSLQIRSTKIRTTTRATASGTIDSMEGSLFILSKNGGHISGRFAFPDGSTYFLQSTPAGQAHVIEVNTRARLPCGNSAPASNPAFPAAVPPSPVTSVLSAPVPSTSADQAAPARLDLLFVYTPSVLQAAGSVPALEAQLDMLVETANICFSNSLINASLNLVHSELTPTEGVGSQLDDLRRLVEPDDGLFDDVHALRELYHADLVCLLVSDHDRAGVSELIFRTSPGYAPFGFFVCEYEQSLTDYTFPHELGHDLGAKHDRANDPTSPSPEFPAGYGYVFTAGGVPCQTVMVPTYAATAIPYYSNPGVSYLGVPTGIPSGQPNSANNADVLNRTAWIVESYRTAPESLADALDTLGIPCRTSHEHPWSFQTSDTHDGIDAVRAADLAAGQTSWIEARLFGPGAVDYWLKIQSNGTDALDLSIDDVLQHSFTSITGWQHPSISLTNGPHLLRWTYRKNGPSVAGEGAWLDQLNPKIPPVLLSRENVPQYPVILTNDFLRVNTESLLRYRIALEGTAPMTYQWTLNGQPLPGKTNATLLFPSLQPTNGGTYQLAVTNSAGAALPFISELQVPDAPPFAWLTTASGSNAIGRSIALDPQSNAFVCGEFTDSISFGSTNLTAGETNHLEHGFLAKFSPSGSLLWVQPITAIGGNDVAGSVRTDPSGNAFVSGVFRANITVGTTTLVSTGDVDIYLAKFDPNGQLLWVRQAGGPGGDSASVAVDSAGDAYLAGTFSQTAHFGNISATSAGGSDAFLAKYSSRGTPLWVVHAGGTNDDLGAAAVADDSGFIYFTGTVSGAVKFQNTQFTSNGDKDSFIAKYTISNGKLTWVSHNGPSPGSSASTASIALDTAGYLLVTGEFAPTGSQVPHGFVDIWDSENGDYITGITLGQFGLLRPRSIRTDPNDNFYITGAINSLPRIGPTDLTTRGGGADDWDGFVVKYTYDLNPIWIKTFGGVDYDYASALAVNSQGDLFLTGAYTGNALFTPFLATGSSGLWFAKIDATTGPNLTAAKTGGSVRLSWPMTAGDLSLESTTDLSPTNTWTNIPYDLQPENLNSVTLPISGKQKFFQLR